MLSRVHRNLFFYYLTYENRIKNLIFSLKFCVKIKGIKHRDGSFQLYKSNKLIPSFWFFEANQVPKVCIPALLLVSSSICGNSKPALVSSAPFLNLFGLP